MEQKWRSKEDPGSVSVYLALSFVMIAALILSLVESARTAAHRFYIQTALDTAMESMFSQYHRPLWENYRLFGLEYRDDEDLITELSDFIKPYAAADNLFPMEVNEATISFRDHLHLTEGTSLEEQIGDYMRYGLIDSLIHFNREDFDASEMSEELQSVFKRAEESERIRELQKKYQLDSRDLMAVEKAIQKIEQVGTEADRIHEDAHGQLCAESAGTFYSDSGKYRTQTQKMHAAVENYIAAAEKLEDKVAVLRQDFEAEKGELSAEAAAAIDAEICEYENYVMENGEIRRQIEQLPGKADFCAAAALGTERDVEEFEAWYWEAWEDAWDSYDEEEDDDDIFEELMEIRTDFFRSKADEWHGMESIRYGGNVARINDENKKILDQIGELVDADMLKLVLPEGAELPSKNKEQDITPAFPAESTAGPVELAIFGEYAFKFFHYYHGVQDSLPPSGAKAMEIEYLINGKESDYENLSAFVTSLVMFREAMNLIYLYTDTEKKNEARAFVAAFLCASGNPALISVFTFFVLSIWALVQAVQDVKMLLDSGRVPVFHTRDTWTFAIEDILHFGKGQSTGELQRSPKGLSYRDYLRAFLLGKGLADQRQIDQRMLFEIERDIRTIGKDPETMFHIDDCLYGLGADILADSSHVMYRLGILHMPGAAGAPGAGYSVRAGTYYRYTNEIM